MAISVAAIGLAALHVARPQLNIDAVTVALVAIAFVPWLAPVIKSVTLPGGFAIELRDVKQQLNQVSQRVSHVERFIFSGSLGASEENRLRQRLEEFSKYLEGLGFQGLSPLPSIRVADDVGGSVFSPADNEISIDKALVEDVEFLLHEYTHYVLRARLGARVIGKKLRPTFDQMEAGVAFYFPCSFLGKPVFGSKRTAEVFGVKTPYVATLENSLGMEDVARDDALGGSVTAGQVWGAALWSMRTRIGSSMADELVARSWLATAQSASHEDVTHFFLDNVIKGVAANAAGGQVDLLRADLSHRGLLRATQ